MRKITDEVLGKDNFLTQMVVKLRHENRILKGDKDFHEVCEYCLIYRKGKGYQQTKRIEDNTSIDKYIYEIKIIDRPNDTIELDGKRVEVYSPEKYEIKKHESPSNDYVQWISVRGSLKDGNSSGRFYMKHLDGIKGKYGYLYKVPDMGKDKFDYRFFMRPPTENHVNGVYFQGVPVDKKEVKFVPYPNFIDYVDVFNNVGSEGGVVFRNGKKPVKFIQHLMLLAGVRDDNNCIVMDFFSGSASTAQAVMQLNSEDGGNRKFIMVQIPEETDEKSEAYKAGYKNICEIGKERIRRAGKKIKEEAGLTAENLDIGFRVLKLDSTNMKDVYYNPAEYDVDMFDKLTDNIKEDRTPEDLLFQVMLDLGVLLSSNIKESRIEGKRIFNVAEGFLIACFDENVTEETIKAIAKQKPYYFVMRDSSMANDSVATNFEQIFATYSPDTIRKVL